MAPQPGQPALLRALNDRRALELLFAHGPLTRGRIGTLSGLSKPTAAQVVQRLESLGLIGPVARVSGGRGPDAVAYGLLPDGRVGVAVDARAHRLAAAVVDVVGTELSRVEAPRTAAEAGVEGAGDTAELVGLVDRACAAAGVRRAQVELAVIGVSAAVDAATDSLRFAEDFPRWPVTGVRRSLAEALGCDVVLDNDVKLAAAAERAQGVAHDERGFALLWMGQGVGLATDLGGVVVRGAAGAAGEIGYLPVPASLQADDPVEPATLQHVLSVSAVLELAHRRGVRPEAVDDARGADPAAEAVLAAVARDPGALEALATRIAACVAPVLAVLDPGLLVLAGPPAVHGGDRLAALVERHVAERSPWRTRVRVTGVPDGAVLTGARVDLLRGLRARVLASVGAID